VPSVRGRESDDKNRGFENEVGERTRFGERTSEASERADTYFYRERGVPATSERLFWSRFFEEWCPEGESARCDDSPEDTRRGKRW
jgi:hypothetical protein